MKQRTIEIISIRSVQELKRLRDRYKTYRFEDLYDEMEEKYRIIRSPELYFLKEVVKQRKKTKHYITEGKWIIYHSKKSVRHLLNKPDYMDFRTTRNRNLINYEEQKILYEKKILVIGLSVGSQVINTLIRTGIGNDYIIADGDTVEVSNFNRTNFNLEDLGSLKVDVVEKYALEIDPYLRITKVKKYLGDRDFRKLLKNIDLVVDSFDNFPMKILLRKIAKKMSIPVISGFDVSRGSMVILERYDKEKDLDISFYLNGYREEDLQHLKDKTIEEKTNLFIKIIGEKYHDDRMLESVYSVGKSLTGYPQMAISTNLTGALWTTGVIDLFLNKKSTSKRCFISLDDVLK